MKTINTNAKTNTQTIAELQAIIDNHHILLMLAKTKFDVIQIGFHKQAIKQAQRLIKAKTVRS